MTNISAVSIAFGISAGTRIVGIANLFIAIIFVVSMVSVNEHLFKSKIVKGGI